jgi:hypothetical protein
MLIGYARISKTDGFQVLDLQKDELSAAWSSASPSTTRGANYY